MVSPHADPIALVSSRHDEWRAEFERERERVVNALESRGLGHEIERIEHVGSTAVPALPAKDIVDLDIVVTDGAVPVVSEALVSVLGGTRHKNSDSWHPVFGEADGQRFNDHVFAQSANGWKISVATATVLRERPALRTEYEQLKRDIAEETDEVETYSKSKSAFVMDLLSVARELDTDFEFEVPERR